MSQDKQKTLEQIIELGIVSVVRTETAEQVAGVVDALKEGGVRAIEITFTVPNAVEMIRRAAESHGDEILLGAGTVTSPSDCAAAIAAGARYIVAPNTDPEVIRLCNVLETPVMPGAMTPTEVLNAWKAGADLIKLFPAEFLGPRYIKNLKGPYPHIPVMPTGGVTPENCAEWLAAGAEAVAAGSSLVDKKALKEGNYAVITENARKFVKAVAEYRGK